MSRVQDIYWVIREATIS